MTFYFGGPEGRLIPLTGGPRGRAPSGAAAKRRGVGTGICTKKVIDGLSMTFFCGDSRIRTGDPMLANENGKIIADRNLANLEIVNYGIVNGQYATQCNMKDSLTKAGLHVNQEMIIADPDIELENLSSIQKTSFKDIFEEYVEIRTGSMFNPDCFRRSRIEVEKPLVKEAYEVLGADKVREMKYHQSNIKREITKLKHETLDTKVFLLLDGQLPKQVAIPKADIKKKLQDIYDELKMNKKASATDLKKWYTVKETTKRADNGGMQACFSIICANIKVAR